MLRRLKGIQGGLLCGCQFGSEAAQIDLTAEDLFSVGEVELKLCSPVKFCLADSPGNGMKESGECALEAIFLRLSSSVVRLRH